MLEALLNTDTVKWAEMPKDEKNGIIVSSRIRLARDLKQIPFPHQLNAESGGTCTALLEQAWQECKEKLPGFVWVDPEQLSGQELKLLIEKRLVTPKFAENVKKWERLLMKEDGSLTVLFNEEDHLRIRCMLPGLALEECWQQASGLDDCLEQVLDYAFDERFGYLTACPTDLGTGMQASVLLHLPAIRMTGQFPKVMQNMSQLGINIHGLFGDGTKAFGNLYQISNQITTGQTETEIYSYLATVAQQLVEQEKQMREDLKQKNPYQFIDRIKRANGLLRNAYMIDASEALSLLSDLRLGVDMQLVETIPVAVINQMTMLINPGHLQRRSEEKMTAPEKDHLRAELLQEKLRAGSPATSLI